MTQSALRLANEARLATEERTRTIGTTPQQVHYQEVAISHLGAQPLALEQYLATTAPSIEMGVASGTFLLTPGAAEIFRVEELIFLMSLASSPSLLEFGDITALGTGLTMQVLDTDDAEILELTGGQNIKSNNDLATLGKLELFTFGATYSLKTTIRPVSPIRLEGGDGEKLRIVVAESLTALTRFRVLARGRLESTLT